MSIKTIILTVVIFLILVFNISPTITDTTFSQENKENIVRQSDDTQEEYAEPSQEDIINNIIKNLQPNLSQFKRREIAQLVINSSKEYELDVFWMLAMMCMESEFKENAVSSEGAIGLMQIMPNTASIYGVSEKQLFTPAINVDTGFRYYRYLLNELKDQRLATIAYNQGIGNVKKGTYETWYYGRVEKAYNEILELMKQVEEEV